MKTTPTRIRVLVVDDDPDIYEMLNAFADLHPLIELVGHATCPEDAVAMARVDPPDVVLLDHSFPQGDRGHADGLPFATSRRLSGLEAVQYLRVAVPDALIAIYTGAPGLDTSARNAGADLYLHKGGDPTIVLDEVARHTLSRLETDT
jgi:DNA-binding NarL/FixJ family response regulator